MSSPSIWSTTGFDSPGLPELVLSPSVCFNAGNIESSLSFFRSCFAYSTLTCNVGVNPWHACLPSIHEELPCVRYATVAVAQRQHAHLQGKAEGFHILDLKSKALAVFASQLTQLSVEAGLSTALLLIALDYAETGKSHWLVHLRGAHRILEIHGGIKLAESRPSLRAQIAMLIWYDVTAAMISRCGVVFPRTYLEALMAWQADEEWSVLALNGLPDEMFLHMQELAVAATHTTVPDLNRLREIMEKISTVEISSKLDRSQAIMGQVWRLGLLLYCVRVFPQIAPEALSPEDQNEIKSVKASSDLWCDPLLLATQILTMAAEIPPHNHCQKQCILPIILAACEIPASHQVYRNIVTDYGRRWREKTGIWIFDSGLEFMRSVWEKNECGFIIENDDDRRKDGWIPWTDVFTPSDGHGFLFG
jgi:hypothetical protein